MVLLNTICTAGGIYMTQFSGAGDKKGMKQALCFAIANLFFASFSGITTATGVLLGQTLGKGQLEEAKTQKEWLLMAAILFGILMSFFMPVWVYVNAQFSVSRAGGDTAMGFWVDGITTVFLVVPLILFLTFATSFGSVTMYLGIKLVDFVKIIIAHFWLKKRKMGKEFGSRIVSWL